MHLNGSKCRVWLGYNGLCTDTERHSSLEPAAFPQSSGLRRRGLTGICCHSKGDGNPSRFFDPPDNFGSCIPALFLFLSFSTPTLSLSLHSPSLHSLSLSSFRSPAGRGRRVRRVGLVSPPCGFIGAESRLRSCALHEHPLTVP